MLEDNPGLDLDTANDVLADIEANLLPWLRISQALHSHQAQDPHTAHECRRLHTKVGKYVEDCCKRISTRLEKDTYRSCR